MPLTPRQVEAITALDWLLDEDNRRVGRSMAFAVALIRQALRHPGRRIAYMDHLCAVSEMVRDRAEDTVRSYVRTFVYNDPRLIALNSFTLQGHHFVQTHPQRIYDWWPEWPDESVLGSGTTPSRFLPEDSPLRVDAWDRLASDDLDLVDPPPGTVLEKT